MLLLPFVLHFVLNAFSADDRIDKILGLQKADKIIKITRKDLFPHRIGEVPFQTCYVYPQYVVVEVDSGQIGADEINIRKLSKPEEAEKICAQESTPGQVRIYNADNYFAGAIDDYVFTISSDGSGAASALWIYNAKTGYQQLSIDYDHDRGLHVKKEGGTVALDFYEELNLKCGLGGNFAGCWERTLKENRIPSSLGLKAPNCKPVFESADFKKYPQMLDDPRAIQIFAEVHIDDIRTHKKEYVKDGPTLCNAAP